ncbi:ATP-dependent RNA helicase [Cavenderia fasciculata]|uniref:ATP-dependent RNA helicase n=1 Tax=Cavenderia fasciculata TaxID=261658 RepID=F4Q0Y8_CACFS|nr:ATP-dependent RNA helicase [Cavenderia fasciculata]EGG18489.1 ATP-dependent RNA helicase [Cavenderia fasciculata]|eukprot:XP_004366393.1 ATP-dependent RNA helicase [Cavenderia fasciculata]
MENELILLIVSRFFSQLAQTLPTSWSLQEIEIQNRYSHDKTDSSVNLYWIDFKVIDFLSKQLQVALPGPTAICANPAFSCDASGNLVKLHIDSATVVNGLGMPDYTLQGFNLPELTDFYIINMNPVANYSLSVSAMLNNPLPKLKTFTYMDIFTPILPLTFNPSVLFPAIESFTIGHVSSLKLLPSTVNTLMTRLDITNSQNADIVLSGTNFKSLFKLSAVLSDLNGASTYTIDLPNLTEFNISSQEAQPTVTGNVNFNLVNAPSLITLKINTKSVSISPPDLSHLTALTVINITNSLDMTSLGFTIYPPNLGTFIIKGSLTQFPLGVWSRTTTTISVSGNFLSGIIPDQFALGAYGAYIDFSSNINITGDVPQSFCQFQGFNALGTSITNIPDCFKCFPGSVPITTSLIVTMPPNCGQMVLLGQTLWRTFDNETITLTGRNLGWGTLGDISANLTMKVANSMFDYRFGAGIRSATISFSNTYGYIKTIYWVYADIDIVSTSSEQANNGTRFNFTLTAIELVPAIRIDGVICLVDHSSDYPPLASCILNQMLPDGNVTVLLSNQMTSKNTNISFKSRFPFITSIPTIINVENNSNITMIGDFGQLPNTPIQIKINDNLCNIVDVSGNGTIVVCQLDANAVLSVGSANVFVNVGEWKFQSSNLAVIVNTSSPTTSGCGQDGCGTHGTCTNSTTAGVLEYYCKCVDGYYGDKCQGTVNPDANPVISDTPTVSYKIGDYQFNFTIVSIQELDLDDQVIYQFFTNNWTVTNNTWNDTVNRVEYRLNQIEGHANQIMSIIEYANVSRSFEFAGVTKQLPPNSIKVSMSIDQWNFQSRLNHLRIVFTTKLGDQSDQCGNDRQSVVIGQDGSLQYLSVFQGDGTFFNGRFLQVSINDGFPTYCRNELLNDTTQLSPQSDLYVGIHIPYAQYSLIDPDFSALINVDNNDSAGCDKDNSFATWKIVVIVVVVGVVAIAVATTSILFYRSNARKRAYNKAMEKMNRLIKLLTTTSTPLLSSGSVGSTTTTTTTISTSTFNRILLSNRITSLSASFLNTSSSSFHSTGVRLSSKSNGSTDGGRKSRIASIGSLKSSRDDRDSSRDNRDGGSNRDNKYNRRDRNRDDYSKRLSPSSSSRFRLANTDPHTTSFKTKSRFTQQPQERDNRGGERRLGGDNRGGGGGGGGGGGRSFDSSSQKYRPKTGHFHSSNPVNFNSSKVIVEETDDVKVFQNKSTYVDGFVPDQKGTGSAFARLGVSKNLMGGLKEMDISIPSLIQQLAIPEIIKANNDIIFVSQTGTGKTLTYLLPIIQNIKKQEKLELDQYIVEQEQLKQNLQHQQQQTNTTAIKDIEDESIVEEEIKENEEDFEEEEEEVEQEKEEVKEEEEEKIKMKPRLPKRPRAIILVPTRELVLQVTAVVKKLAHYEKVSCCGISGGGGDITKYLQMFRSKPVDIVVSTPGILISLIEKKNIVVDEADSMFTQGKGFDDDMKKILAPVEYRLKNKHVEGYKSIYATICSATLTQQLLSNVQSLFPNVVKLATPTIHKSLNTLEQQFISVQGGDKHEALMRAIKPSQSKRVLVFCNSPNSCRSTEYFLTENGFNATSLHGEIPPKTRSKNWRQFLNNEKSILVSTDIASRGIDVSSVDHVIIFDFPSNPIDYLHRIGRTARAGKKGTVTCIIAKKDQVLANAIQAALKRGDSLESLSSNKKLNPKLYR